MTLPILCSSANNDVSSTLTVTFHHLVDTTIAVQPGDITSFGTPTPTNPIRIRLALPSQYNGSVWTISDPTAAATYRATGITGSALTGVTFESGTNQDFATGSLIAVAVTARDFSDIHTYLHSAGPVNILTAGAPIGVTVVGDGIADDHAAIQSIADANPGRILYCPRTISDADFAASGGFRPSYYMGNTLTLTPGAGVFGSGGVSATWTFRFAPSKAGIRMADGCVLENLAILGSDPWNGLNFWEGIIPAGRYPGVTVGAGGNAADGVQVAGGSCRLANVAIAQFGRDAVNMSAGDLGLGSGFGAECCTLDGPVYVAFNRGHGIYVAGGDSNCNGLGGVNAIVNQFWAINNDSFLAGATYNPQADQNGFDNSANLLGSDNHTAAVASLVRSSNIVTLTWSSAYTPALHVGDGVRIATCTDASFLGRWRILSVAGDNLSLTFTQVAANATVTGGTTARANFLPHDYVIQSAARASNVVTLTGTAPLVITSADCNNAAVTGQGFLVGQGVTLVNCPDATFNGTFVVLSVSTDKRTVTYAQTAANATITSGTVRMAIPEDTWQCTCVPAGGTAPERLQGGSYRATQATSNQVWTNLYAEGGQRFLLNSNCLVLNPTLSDIPEFTNTNGGGYCSIITSAAGLLATNRPWSLSVPYDGDVVANEQVGATVAGKVITTIGDVGRLVSNIPAVAWKYVRSAAGWWIYRGDSTKEVAPIRLSVDYDHSTGNGDTHINSDGTGIVRCNIEAGTGTGGFAVGIGTGTNPTTLLLGGQIVMIPIADSVAQNGAVYLSTDHLDGGGAPKLCRKSSAGATTVLG